MKTLKLLLVLLILATTGRVEAGNATIQFDSNFKAIGSTSVEPNQTITLTGKIDPSSVVGFKITVVGALTPQEVKVNLKNDTWTAQVGPFFANQQISLKFDVKSKLTDEEFEDFRKQFEETFNSIVDWIETDRASHQENYAQNGQFYDAFAKKFREKIPAGFQQYKDKNAKPATELLLDALAEDSKAPLFDYANELKNVKEARSRIETLANEILNTLKTKTDLFPKAQDYFNALKSGLGNTVTPTSKDEILNKIGVAKDTLLYPEIESLSEKIAKQYNTVVESNNSKEKLLSKIEVLKDAEVTCSLENTTALSIDIKQFIGFDIVPMVFTGKNRPGDSSFGLFLTASPYFGRVNSDEKIWYPSAEKEDSITRARRMQGNWKRSLTPTFGIALATSPDAKISPIVFGGVGARINQIVRLTIGCSAYSGTKTEVDSNGQATSTKKETKACFTMGIGINVNYFGEVLKIFTTASSNLKP